MTRPALPALATILLLMPGSLAAQAAPDEPLERLASSVERIEVILTQARQDRAVELELQRFDALLRWVEVRHQRLAVVERELQQVREKLEMARAHLQQVEDDLRKARDLLTDPDWEKVARNRLESLESSLDQAEARVSSLDLRRIELENRVMELRRGLDDAEAAAEEILPLG